MANRPMAAVGAKRTFDENSKITCRRRPRCYIDELDPEDPIIRLDPDGTRHVLGDEDVIVNSLPS
jgi:hypothetical protein